MLISMGCTSDGQGWAPKPLAPSLHAPRYSKRGTEKSAILETSDAKELPCSCGQAVALFNEPPLWQLAMGPAGPKTRPPAIRRSGIYHLSGHFHIRHICQGRPLGIRVAYAPEIWGLWTGEGVVL